MAADVIPTIECVIAIMSGLLGLFGLLWTDDGYILKGAFFQEPDGAKIIESMLMRISIALEPSKPVTTLPTPKDTMIYAIYSQFKDAKRKVQKLIVGVELQSTEKPEDYKAFVSSLAEGIREYLDKEKDEVDKYLGAMLATRLGITQEKTDVGEDLKSRIISKAKDMIAKGNIDDAEGLLEKAKTVPSDIKRLIEKGSKLLKQEKIDEARKSYDDAILLAIEVHEDDLAQKFRDEFSRASERPRTVERVVSIEDAARHAVREENFKNASELYMDAAKEVAKLNDVETMNEFTRKSQIFLELFKIDKSKKRSF